MTEIEKIAYAKSFIDKLANGINPLDDTEIKSDDVVNNVRLSRCFFYVSDILRQVIENGGIGRINKKRDKKKPFYISPERLAEFEFSDEPIAISEIARRITALTDDEDMKKVTHRDLNGWLISIGMLCEIITAEGKTVKRPTEQGYAIGISIEDRVGRRGAYTVVLYNKDAQGFILDNFDAVMALKRR